jgi:hypothetical protein
MVTQEHPKKHTPETAVLEIWVGIDHGRYNELVAQGFTPENIKSAIENSVTTKDTVNGVISTPPITGLLTAELVKYY